jgi:uncharacterized protein with PQ loop repeat
MTIQAIIDSATMVAFFALSVDIIFQIFHVIKRRSSKDVSIKGSVIRLAAVTTFLIKFILGGDPVLIIGQAIFVSAYVVYFLLLVYYRNRFRRGS